MARKHNIRHNKRMRNRLSRLKRKEIAQRISGGFLVALGGFGLIGAAQLGKEKSDEIRFKQEIVMDSDEDVSPILEGIKETGKKGAVPVGLIASGASLIKKSKKTKVKRKMLKKRLK